MTGPLLSEESVQILLLVICVLGSRSCAGNVVSWTYSCKVWGKVPGRAIRR